MPDAATHASSENAPGLARQLGLFDALATVVGSIIGSGIFVVPSIVLATVKDPSIALLVWLIGGILTLFGTLTLAELAGVRPQTGGIYIYLRDAYGPLIAFLFGWTTFWVMQTGSTAAVSVVFGTYLGGLIHLSAWQVKGAALFIIWLLTVVNILGVRHASAIQNLFSSLKFLALAALIAFSFALVHTSATNFTPIASISAIRLGDMSSISLSLVGILFAYEGWTYVTFIGGEIKNAERTLPRAIVLGVILVIFVYVLANYSYLRVLDPAAVAASPHVAADTAVRLLGRAGGIFITLAILASTFGATNSCILTSARSYFAMARDNLFFKSLGRVHPVYKTPAVSLLAQGVWCSVLVLSGTYSQLFTYVIFAAWTFYALAAGGVFVFRRKYPYPKGSYRTFGYPVTTFLFIAAAGGIVLNTLVRSPRESLIGLALMLSGLPAYYYWRRRDKTRPRVE